MQLCGLKPLIGKDPKVLLLGSFPSVTSLEKKAYYAFPRNHLWKIMEGLFNENLPETWDQRSLWLKGHHIAVWDVLESCERPGSLDQNISKMLANPVPDLVKNLPSLEALALNGGTASKCFRRFFPSFSLDFPQIAVFNLPSSSPISSKKYKKAQDKLELWREAFSPCLINKKNS